MNRTSVRWRSMSWLVLALGFSGCATGASAGKQQARLRGAVVTRAATSVALVRGPGELHVYAGFSGGAIYAAAARTGTDADCSVAEHDRRGQKVIEGDRMETLSLPEGMVGCLATRTERTYEVLWHVRPQRTSPVSVPQPDVLVATGVR